MKAKTIHLAAAAIAVAFASCMAFAEGEAKAAEKTDAAKAAAGTAEKTYKPLAEARAKIGDVIADPEKMVEVMKDLSPEDQKTYVADVNTAISKLPGSTEDKTAKFLNVNRAALKGASSGNMANVLAVTFATVPPESLTVISERYAVDLFNRDADPSQRLPDATFEKTATEVCGKVAQATSGSDDAGVRNTLAILMFVRSSNGSIDGLADRLVETMPDSATRELAKKEWIPSAMAEGEKKTYDSMLAYADAGKAPNTEAVINMAGPQILDAMLVDITSAVNDEKGYATTPIVDQAFGGFDEARVVNAEEQDSTSAVAAQNGGGGAVPRTTADVPWNPEYKRDDPITPEPSPTPEPKPYPYTGM